MSEGKVILVPTYGFGTASRPIEMEVPETLGTNLHRIFLEDSGTGTTTNYVLNADGIGETDWVVSGATQLGDHWSIRTFNLIDYTTYNDPSIVTGNGFSGNAQRLDAKVAYPQADLALTSNLFDLTEAGDYVLSFKYRSLDILKVFAGVAGEDQFDLPVNTGSASSLINLPITISTPLPKLNYHITFMTYTHEPDPDNKWFEIDEVTFIQVLK